jgi:8-oxo-dGTP pyrophosphatase MutT (NUDIX family)
MHEATVCHLQRGVGDTAEILLGRRVSLFANGFWNGPGGKFKNGETILECLRREVREEVGVRVNTSKAKHFATVDFFHPCSQGYSLE